MGEDPFQSMSKGVFVIPYQVDNEDEDDVRIPGPPSTIPWHPLVKLCNTSMRRYHQHLAASETDRTLEQLDDITDWLERCSAPPILKLDAPIHRVPIAILQDTSNPLASEEASKTLGSNTRAFTLHGRGVTDLTSAMRAISTGYVGEPSVSSRRTGQTGLDEVEKWWNGTKNKPEILLHIQDAQTIPSTLLGEIIYVLTLHPSLPIRLLLLVPSTAHFLSIWTLLEPSSIALSILSSGKRRRRGPVEAVLHGSKAAPILISDDLAEELSMEESRSGGGTALVIKSIKWLLLHYGNNSPLARLVSTANDSQLQKIQALVDGLVEHPDDPSLPGRELFKLDPHPDLSSVLNPAPRISILHALSNSGDFIPSSTSSQQPEPKDTDRSPSPSPSPSPIKSARSNKRKSTTTTEEPSAKSKRSKLQRPNPATEDTEQQEEEAVLSKGEELKELQILYELWRSAGRSVNLWDWLEGFSGFMSDLKPEHEEQSLSTTKDKIDHDRGSAGARPQNNGDGDLERDHEMNSEPALSEKPPKETSDEDGHAPEKEHGAKEPEEDEENQARLHAVFVRFVEEARMIGLIRARGKGRKADEVVKGVGLV